MDPDSSNVRALQSRPLTLPSVVADVRAFLTPPLMPFARGGPSPRRGRRRMALIVVDLSKQRRAKSQV